MPTDNEMKIKLQVQHQKAKAAFGEIEKGIKNVENQAKSSEKELNRMRVATAGLRRTMGALRNNLLLVSFAFGGTFVAIKKTIEAFGEQELAEKKLETALGRTSQALLSQASALQKVTTFGDEQIIQAQALIAAFTDDEESIKRATSATLDLAAAKGMDLNAAADLISKTLGSSTNALSRYGIEVTGAVGSTERLNSLTKNIAETFGGQATAQAETLTGSLTQMSNAVGDAAEAVGGLLAPAVQVTAGVIKTMAEELSRVITFHDDLARVAAMEVVGILTTEEAAVSKLTESLNNMTQKDIINKISALQGGLAVSAIEKDMHIYQELFHNIAEGANSVNTFAVNADNLDTTNLKLTEGFLHQFDLLKLLIEAYEFAPEGITAYDEVFQEFIDTQNNALSNYEQEQQLIADFVNVYPEVADKLGLVTDAQKKSNDEAERAEKVQKRAMLSSVKSAMSQAKAHEHMGTQAHLAAERAVMASIQKAVAEEMAEVMAKVPFPFSIPAAAVAASLVGAAMQSALSGLKGLKLAATGMDEVVNKPTLIMAGEAGPESVQITPLEGPNIDGPQGSSVTVNVSGNVLSQDFVEGELAENIKEAVRRGTDFGIS